MIHVGIEAIGIYVPPGRLAIAELRQYWPGVPTPGGVQTVSVAGFDEDIVTMGVEAAEVTLASIDAPVTSIDLLVVATCSSPRLVGLLGFLPRWQSSISLARR